MNTVWVHPQWNPVAFTIAGWPIRWYGLAYAVSLGVAWALGRRWVRRGQWLAAQSGLSVRQWDDVVAWLMLGVLLGGRVGYVAVYGLRFQHYSWGDALAVWQGGMSFHGALVGVSISLAVWCRRHRVSLLAMTDWVTTVAPWGIALGRLANFINGELWGRPTHATWGMVFPWVDQQLRHPSELYEMGAEGLLLGTMMWLLARRRPPLGVLTGAFLLNYGLLRTAVESFRAPDVQWGLVWGGLTVGQCLSLPMVALGGWCMWYSHTHGFKPVQQQPMEKEA